MESQSPGSTEDYYELALRRLSALPSLSSYSVRFLAHIPWFHRDTWHFIAAAPEDQVAALARALRGRDRLERPAAHRGPWASPGAPVPCVACGGTHRLEGAGDFLFFTCGDRRMLGALAGRPV